MYKLKCIQCGGSFTERLEHKSSSASNCEEVGNNFLLCRLFACSQKPIFADAGHANCMCTPAGTCKAHTKAHNYYIKVVFK